MAKLDINDSANLTALDFGATFDISGINTPPTIIIKNLAEGTGQANMTWWLLIKSPSGVTIHEGAFITPDEVGVWTDWDSAVEGVVWPQPNLHVEYGAYMITLYTRTTNNTEPQVYQWSKPFNLCALAGNKGKNNFGAAKFSHKVLCKDNVIVATETTNYLYQSAVGVSEATYPKWLMKYPAIQGEDGGTTQPTNEEAEGINSVLFPAKVNGAQNIIELTNVVKFTIAYDFAVIGKFKGNAIFNVACGIDISPLICDYNEYLQDYYSCTTPNSNNPQRLIRHQMITDKMTLLLSTFASNDSCCNIDTYALVKEIKELGNFSCNCSVTGPNNAINPNIIPIVQCFQALNITTSQPLSVLNGMIEALQKAACNAAQTTSLPVFGTPNDNDFVMFRVPGVNAPIELEAGLIRDDGAQFIRFLGRGLFLYGTSCFERRLQDSDVTPNDFDEIYRVTVGSVNPVDVFSERYVDNNDGTWILKRKITALVTKTVYETANTDTPFEFQGSIQSSNPNGANTAGVWKFGKAINTVPGTITHMIRVNIDGVNYKIGAVPE